MALSIRQEVFVRCLENGSHYHDPLFLLACFEAGISPEVGANWLGFPEVSERLSKAKLGGATNA
jgi:hypothetical protein